MKTLIVVAVMLAAGCGRECRWESRGVCVAIDDERITAEAPWTEREWQSYLDGTIDNALAYWNAPASSLDGWTIVLHLRNPSCYGSGRAACAYPLINEIHARSVEPCPTELLPHEIGHAVSAGYDPGHSRDEWRALDAEPRAVAVCWDY